MFIDPEVEAERLRVLESFQVLDTPPEQAFDDIVRVASLVCGAPIALVTLVDAARQWFKARVGTDVQETPRELSFCQHALARPEVLQVPDATEDPRFCDNPLVTGDAHVRFYAGAPLVTSEGATLGTLCVIDRTPRRLTPAQTEVLVALSRQVVMLLELRRQLATVRSIESAQREERGARDALYRRIVEQSGDGIVVADTQGVLRLWNPEVERQLGVRFRELPPGDWARAFGLYTLERRPMQVHEMPLYRALQGERVQNARWYAQRPDGTMRLLEGTAVPLTDGAGRPAGGLIMTRDVTDFAAHEEALRESEARLRTTLEQAAVGIIEVAADGRCVRANRRACQLLGREPEVLARHTFGQLLHPEDVEAYADELDELLSGNRERFRMAVRFLRRDRTQVPVVLAVSAVRGTGGMPDYFVAGLADGKLVTLDGGDPETTSGPLVALPLRSTR